MGRCIQHVACPECRKIGKDKKGNNLGIYDDGGVYCFSCGFSIHGNNRTSLPNPRVYRTENKKIAITYGELFLPTGSSLDWLYKYHLTDSQIEQYNIKWSIKEKALVFPIYKDKELIFYQLRYFEKGKSKWRSYGTKPLIYLGNSAPIVLVEDIISAIRVGEIATAVPLFGSTISTKSLLTIRKQYDNIIIWLDYDKANDKKTKQAIAACKAIFKETKQIITEKDPKAYTTEDIRYQINSI